MNIVLDADTSDCPGAICKVLNSTESRSILVQQDTDAPGVASAFGWSPRYVTSIAGCRHLTTDGTVDCQECGVKAIQFIESAIEFLNDNDGAVADDPGYF